jgi:hypothetical protein
MLCSSDSLFEFAYSGFLISLRLREHSLESLYSLSHASVEGGLNGMEVIVKILSETYQERERLFEAIL